MPRELGVSAGLQTDPHLVPHLVVHTGKASEQAAEEVKRLKWVSQSHR